MFTLALFTLFSYQDASVFVDRVAIKVNDKIVTEREVMHEYKGKRAMAMQNATGADLDRRLQQAWQRTMDEVEQTLLLYEKAMELGIAFSEEDVRTRLVSMKEANGMTDQEFEEEIQNQTGMTFQEYVDLTVRKESATRVIQSQVFSQISIEESEVARYYDEHKEEFMDPATYRLSEIVLLKGDQDPVALQMKLKLVINAFNEGEDFAELAKTYSDANSAAYGGDLGTVEYGDLRTEIENQAKQLAVGAISEPFETDDAWFIVQLTERTEPKPKPLDVVRQSIVAKLREPLIDSRIDAYITDLKEIYQVEIYLEDSPTLVE